MRLTQYTPACALRRHERFRPRLEEVEPRVLPASPVLLLNNFALQGFTRRGFEDSSFAGSSVGGAGDVNGDGFADVIIGAPRTNAGGTDRGEAYVVMGGPARGGEFDTLDHNTLFGNGFILRGFEDDAQAGFSVAGAGDVNGDGFADVIVGAPFTNAGGTNRGEAYVVFGSPGLIGTTITLNALGAGGFTLRGFEDLADAGRCVAGAGDVNGDGFADLIVGAPFTNAGGTDRGEAYVVFGGKTLGGTTVTLNALGAGGFTLRGFENGAIAGVSAAGAGDVNGDGFADLIVGAPYADVGGTNRGESYVVFGGSGLGGTTVTLNAIGASGLTAHSLENFAYAGQVAGAGDVNGDGFSDLIVGAYGADAGGTNRGEAYVVFGGTTLGGTTINFAGLGAAGFTLRGFEDWSDAGGCVAGAGDMNGDGFADLIVGARLTNAGGTNRGESYVVFGGSNRANTTVALNALGGIGFTLRGFEDTAVAGWRVAGAGDVDGDGFADVIVGAPNTNAYGTDRGEAYIIFAPLPPTIAVGSDAGSVAKVTVFDARNGQPRATLKPYPDSFLGGARVSTADLDRDGADDIIVAPGPGPAQNVRVFDGRTLGLALEFLPYNASFTGGVFVATGDVNGDGAQDIVIAAGPGGGPHVKVLNGTNSALLASFYAYAPGFTGGAVVACGDVTGDGKADVLTAAGAGGGPHVKVLDGTKLNQLAPSGQILATAEVFGFFAYASGFTGGVWIASRDVTGDGKADIITGAGPGGSPHVKVFNGATGGLLHSFLAYGSGFGGGVRVGAADVNGDGRYDVFTGPGPGGGPLVKAFRGTDAFLLESFYALDPGFVGGIFVG